MKTVLKRCLIAAAAAFFMGTSAAGPGFCESDLSGLQEAFVRISGDIKPSVVNILAVFEETYAVPQQEFFFGSPFEDFFEDFFSGPSVPRRRQKAVPRSFRYEGMGSGVIIDPKGYVLTNEHVVRGAKEIIIKTHLDKEYKGKVIGRDARTDLAVVKVKTSDELPFARLGDSDRIRVGEWAIAIGSPFGLQETVTVGVISALRQSLSIEGREYRDLIQTDAAINRGNSGGPLCNIKGEVVGINTAIYAPTGVFSGVGFAIPINSAKEILDDLIHKGRVVRGWLGVEIRPLDETIARQFGLKDTSGVLVNNVFKDSPADKAGLISGDIIVGFARKQTGSVRDLQDAVSQTKPKSKVNIKIMRDGKEKTLSIVTGEMPQDELEDFEDISEDKPEKDTVPGSHEWLGMEVAVEDDQVLGDGGRKGCTVVSVRRGSIAEAMGILKEDKILEINRQKTTGPDEFTKAAKKAKLSEGVVLMIERQNRTLYLSYVGEDE
ncbi:MAG: Do family serine endopeptidase [Endomicrobiales bacterium]|nr:Do family serine endopeptidase [Endomicrobiales bacterium]